MRSSTCVHGLPQHLEDSRAVGESVIDNHNAMVERSTSFVSTGGLDALKQTNKLRGP
jgi:hypothetical protein